MSSKSLALVGILFAVLSLIADKPNNGMFLVLTAIMVVGACITRQLELIREGK